MPVDPYLHVHTHLVERWLARQTLGWARSVDLLVADSRVIRVPGSLEVRVLADHSYQQRLRSVHLELAMPSKMLRPDERRRMSITAFILFFIKLLNNPLLVTAFARFLSNALKTLM